MGSHNESSTLFILSTEVINEQISQITKLRVYADDTALIMLSKQSFVKAIEAIKNFGTVSVLLLNKDKHEGMWLGSYKDAYDEILYIRFRNETIKCQGISFGNSDKQTHKLNWTGKIKKAYGIK